MIRVPCPGNSTNSNVYQIIPLPDTNTPGKCVGLSQQKRTETGSDGGGNGEIISKLISASLSNHFYLAQSKFQSTAEGMYLVLVTSSSVASTARKKVGPRRPGLFMLRLLSLFLDSTAWWQPIASSSVRAAERIVSEAADQWIGGTGCAG